MSEQIYTTVIITPAEGKWNQVREALVNAAKEVEANEPNVLQYQFFEQYNGENGKNSFVAIEIYKDQASVEAHLQTSTYKKLGERIEKEGLLACAPDLKLLKSVAGFRSR